MNTTIALALIGIACWKWKNNFSNHVTLDYRFKLKDIHFQLTKLAIDGQVNIYDKRFRDLDNNMANMIQFMPSLNLFLILLYTKTKRYRDTQVRKPVVGYKKPTQSLKDRKIDLELLKLQKEFNGIFYRYLIHKTAIVMVIGYLFLWFKPFNSLFKKLQLSIKRSIISPITNEFEFPLAFKMTASY